MTDPLGAHNIEQLSKSLGLGTNPSTGGVPKTDAIDFKDTLLDSLDQVNRLQKEAAQGVQKLATGETNNVAEVFSAVRKADVAFSMLMEMRNKLIEAYRDLQQMRV